MWKAETTTYKVICFCADDSNEHHREIVQTGLTLEEAQAICRDPATIGDDPEHGGRWFYGYDYERER